jgi:hypothetical protein
MVPQARQDKEPWPRYPGRARHSELPRRVEGRRHAMTQTGDEPVQVGVIMATTTAWDDMRFGIARYRALALVNCQGK